MLFRNKMAANYLCRCCWCSECGLCGLLCISLGILLVTVRCSTTPSRVAWNTTHFVAFLTTWSRYVIYVTEGTRMVCLGGLEGRKGQNIIFRSVQRIVEEWRREEKLLFAGKFKTGMLRHNTVRLQISRSHSSCFGRKEFGLVMPSASSSSGILL